MPLGDAFRFATQQRSVSDRTGPGDPIVTQLGLVNNTPGTLQVSWTEPGRPGLVVRNLDGFGVVPLPDGVTESALSGDTKARITVGDIYVETRELSAIPEVEMPRFAPPAGTMFNGVTVTIECEPGSFVTYLMSKEVPQPTDTRYGGAIVLSLGEHVISARAFKRGMRPSLVARVNYTVYVPPAEAPVVTAAGPALWTTDTVSLASPTPGAEVRYTINGATPGPSSTLYTGPFTLPAGTITVRAVANAVGYLQSPEGTAAFTVTVQPVTQTPQVSFPTGPIYANDTITLTAEAGALIYYTLDGSTPTTSSTLYTGPFTLPPGTYTLRYIAVLPGSLPSAVQTQVLIITAQPANSVPVISVALNTLLGTANVSMTGQDIYFTLDGSTPTTASPRYVGPFQLGLGSTTISAFSSTPRYVPSAVATTVAAVTQLPQVDTPTASESGGTVTLSSTTAGATIRYTLDGSAVGGAALTYSAPFVLQPGTTVVTAVASKTNYRDSASLVTAVVVPPPAQTATPTTNLDGTLTIDSTFAITLACSTPGATIRYRTSSTGTYVVYSGPFALATSGAAVLEAYATAPGLLQSGLLTRSVTRRVATPVISFVPPTYDSTAISLSSESGAVISYRIDGGTWSTYATPFYLSAGTHSVEAYASKAGAGQSATASQTLTVAHNASGVPAVPTLSPVSGTLISPANPRNVMVTWETDAIVERTPAISGIGDSTWQMPSTSVQAGTSASPGLWPQSVAQEFDIWSGRLGAFACSDGTAVRLPLRFPRSRFVQVTARIRDYSSLPVSVPAAWQFPIIALRPPLANRAHINDTPGWLAGDVGVAVRHDGHVFVTTTTVSGSQSSPGQTPPTIQVTELSITMPAALEFYTFELTFDTSTGTMGVHFDGQRAEVTTGWDFSSGATTLCPTGNNGGAWVRIAAVEMYHNRTLPSELAPLGCPVSYRAYRNGLYSAAVTALYPSVVQTATVDVTAGTTTPSFFRLNGSPILPRGIYTVVVDNSAAGGTWRAASGEVSTDGLIICGSSIRLLSTEGRYQFVDSKMYRTAAKTYVPMYLNAVEENWGRLFLTLPVVIDMNQAEFAAIPASSLAISVQAGSTAVSGTRRFILARLSPQYG